MSSTPQICDGQVVEFHYTLTDESGETLDDSRGGRPLMYLHGAGNVVPGLERALTGASVETFTAVIPPADGYGEYEEPGPQPVTRAEFPETAEIEEGAVFQFGLNPVRNSMCG